MAASNQELRYMVVFTTQGKPEIVEATDDLKRQNSEFLKTSAAADDYADGLQRLKSGMGSISRPSRQVILSQKQLQGALQQTQKGMMKTGQHTATTNNLLIALTRGAQDAQFGMMGVANNLQQSAELAASASQKMGGMKNVVMGLASSFMNPATGLIIGVTAITTAWQLAESGALSFSTEIENLDEITEGYVDTIDQLINQMNELVFGDEDFFSTEQLQQRLSMQKAIQTQEEQRLKVLKKEYKELNDIAVNSPADLDVDRFQEVQEEMQFIEGFLETTKEKQLELEGEILVKKRAMKNEDLARIAYGNQIVEIMEQEDEILKKWGDYDVGSQITSDIQKMNDSMAEGEDPLSDLGDSSNRVKELRARMQAQLKFDEQIEQQRINLVRQSGNEIQALRMEEQRELNELANNDLINDRQREEMRLLIIEEYNNKEVELERQKAEKIKDMHQQINNDMAMQDQWLHDQRINMTTMAADTILAINQGFLGDNKALNALIFGVEKAFQIANVIIDTQRKAAQATMTGMSLLSNPLTAPLAGNAFAQAAAIKTTGYLTAGLMGAMTLAKGGAMMAGGGGSRGGSGGSGGGGSRNPLRDFRGIDAQSMQGDERNSWPKTVRLEDSAGKFLTKLQFAKDQEKPGGYLSDA